MKDKDANLEISLNGEPFILTRYNTTLYTHLGRVILRGFELEAKNFDHIFIQTGTIEEAETKGGFLFRGHPAYKSIAKFILEHEFPSFINQSTVASGDVEAWEKFNFEDLNSINEVPENWTNEQS